MVFVMMINYDDDVCSHGGDMMMMGMMAMMKMHVGGDDNVDVDDGDCDISDDDDIGDINGDDDDVGDDSGDDDDAKMLAMITVMMMLVMLSMATVMTSFIASFIQDIG